MPSHPPQFATAFRYASQGAYPEAITLFQQAVASYPSHLESRLQLAKACLDWVNVQARKPLTEIDPDTLSGDAIYFLQLAESQLNFLAGKRPLLPHVLRLLAIVHLIYDRPSEAFECLKKALSKDSGNPDLLYNQGYSLMKMKQYANAAKVFNKLVTLYPKHGMGWQMLGEAKHATGDLEAALSAYQHAMDILPEAPETFSAVARAYNMLERFDEAKNALLAGLKHHPEHQDMNVSLSKLALSTEDWDTGWRYYACRHTAGKRLPIPKDYVFDWQPEHPVRVRFDQGLGDELHFLRFLPALVSKGMRIHYACHPKLYSLLQDQPYIEELKATTVDQPGDYDCLVGDLPWLAGMHSTADIPPSLVLSVDSMKVDALRKQLSEFGPPPYLGVTWQGGREKKPDRKTPWRMLYKEISPVALGEIGREWPGTVVVMQRIPKAEDLSQFSKALGRNWLDWSALNENLHEVLAGLSLLDEYVGVSNTNMHLMAGIGKTARVLVPFPADWRWMAKGDESPWFPGFGVYRQTREGDWQDALYKLGMDLSKWNAKSC